jgi:hypothetical protein
MSFKVERLCNDHEVLLCRKGGFPMTVIVNGLLGILTGGVMIALSTNTLAADTGGILLMFLGLGLVGLGLSGRKKIPIGTRYLALGMREVNLRGASLFQRPGGKEGRPCTKMF